MRLCVLLGVRHFDKQRSINDYNAYLSSPSLLQTMDQWVLLSPPQVPFSAAADAGTALWGLGELATRSAAAHRSQTGRGASKGGKSVQYWLVKVPWTAITWHLWFKFMVLSLNNGCLVALFRVVQLWVDWFHHVRIDDLWWYFTNRYWVFVEKPLGKLENLWGGQGIILPKIQPELQRVLWMGKHWNDAGNLVQQLWGYEDVIYSNLI